MPEAILFLFLLATCAFAQQPDYDVPGIQVSPSFATISTSGWSTGPKSVLVIRLQFTNLSSGSTYARDVQVMDMVAQRFLDSSFGKTSLQPTITGKVYTLPHQAAYYNNNRAGIAADAATAVKVDYGDVLQIYDRVIFQFPQLQMGGFIGYADISGKRVWLNGQFNSNLICHELGHTYGLYHAHSWVVTNNDPTSDIGTTKQYGDGFDIMGQSDSRGDFNESYKSKLGWLIPGQVIHVAQSGTYRIYRFDSPLATGALGLNFAKPGDATKSYWIGYRRNFVATNGAYVQWGETLSNTSWLIDWVPTTGFADAAVPIGRTLVDGPLRITPVGSGGIAPHEWLDVKIVL